MAKLSKKKVSSKKVDFQQNILLKKSSKEKPTKKSKNSSKKNQQISKRNKKNSDQQLTGMETLKERILKKIGRSDDVFQQRQTPSSDKTRSSSETWVKTNIPGFDALFEYGIPKENNILICGGPGSGKTIFCLQVAYEAAKRGEKTVYMSFEESEDHLRKHMRSFGWNPDELEKKGTLIIKRYDSFDISRQVEAMLERSKGELLIDVKPLLFPKGFTPEWVVIDSISALSASFIGKEDVYRTYIDQLFRMLENLKTTSLLITESTNIPIRLSESGIEEFLADGVVVMYNTRVGEIRESGIEVLKMRGTKFDKRIVVFQITNSGIQVYPDQVLYSTPEQV